jgi:hypothetical protein
MNRKLTAPTRPRISSGVEKLHQRKAYHTLIVSAAPSTASASTDSHIHCDSANTTVASAEHDHGLKHPQARHGD